MGRLTEREWTDAAGRRYEVCGFTKGGRKVSRAIIESRFSPSRAEIYADVERALAKAESDERDALASHTAREGGRDDRN